MSFLHGHWKVLTDMKDWDSANEENKKTAMKHRTAPVLYNGGHSFPQLLNKKIKVAVYPTYAGETPFRKLSPFDAAKIKETQEKISLKRESALS